MSCRLVLFTAFTALLPAAPLWAECVELQILHREPFADGKSFGDVGPYERIVGVATFAVDPQNARNQLIVDLDKAPLNRNGKVEFRSDFFILTPKDPARGRGAVLYDVNNRGNKLALGFFNDAASSNDPRTADHAGNGFLMRHGFTVVWCGWIGELLPGGNRLLLQPPIATEKGKPITGIVRFETGADGPADSLPLSRRPGHGSYNPTLKGERDGVLTWRMREKDPRVTIPRSLWKLERNPPPPVKEGVSGTLSEIRLKVSGGFRPGYLYELICECENPIVQGVGFAAVRDLVSLLKFDGTDKNPLARNGKSPIDRALGFGISQSGRFLRHFVYQAFNADEKGRKVFDGLMPHVAGGGLGFFNHRFAQPTRHNSQHDEHLYPADVFPFTYGEARNSYWTRSALSNSSASSQLLPLQFDPHLDAFANNDEQVDGILSRFIRNNETHLLPKVMHTQSAAEYWHRSGSLVHTEQTFPKNSKEDGPFVRDAVIPESVRIYAFGGCQHGPAADPPRPGNGDQLPNPGNFKPLSRALLLALDAWAKEGKAPPPSVYPKVADGTLVDWNQQPGFPAIPGVRYPGVIQQASVNFFGDEFQSKKIIAVEPPALMGYYRVLVPKSDRDGNDLGTLLPPEVAVPLATYTGWNLRKKEIGAEGMLLTLQGSYIPFLKTAVERAAKGDTRQSIAERYDSFEDYLNRCQAVCARYVAQGYLLGEDAERWLASRVKVREQFPDKKR